MLRRVDPDKVRFVDLGARESRALVHSVELSDDRSPAHFVTLFFKGRDPVVDAFVTATGLRAYNHHDPAVYHRGDERTAWVVETFPDRGPPWTFHWHKRLQAPPTLADLEPFRAGLSEALLRDLDGYFTVALPAAAEAAAAPAAAPPKPARAGKSRRST